MHFCALNILSSFCSIFSIFRKDNLSRPVVQRRAGGASLQRRASNCSIQGGVPYTNSHSQFYSMYQKKNQFSSFNRNCSNQISPPPHGAPPNAAHGALGAEAMFNVPQDPRQLEATVRKMETYLALLNQIQSQMGNNNPRINPSNNSLGFNQSNEVKRSILKQNKPVQR